MSDINKITRNPEKQELSEDMSSHDQTEITTLLKLILEITGSHVLDYHPEERIQQIISRVGKVMNIRYSSFLDIQTEFEKIKIREKYLWSNKYGYLIGSDFDNIETDPCFMTLLLQLQKHHPIIIKQNDTSGIINELMRERQSGSMIMVPLIHNNIISGILVFFNESDTRSWIHTEITTLKILASVIETGISKKQIEDILKRSEKKFQGLIDQIGDMYFMTDKSGFLKTVNRSMVKTLGYETFHDLEGISFENIIHPPEYWPIFLSDIISNEGVKDYEIQLLTSDNHILYSSISCRLIYDDEGMLQGIEGVIRDISRRKQYGDLLSDIEWKLEEAQKIARMGVWSYDSSLNLFRVSPEVFTLLGIPAEQNYVNLEDFIQRSYPQDKEKLQKYFPNALKLGSDFDFEFRVSLQERKFKYLRIKGKPLIKKGIKQGSFGILQDITERKDVEKHLMKYATELEQKTLELDAMRTQLLDMNRELDIRVRRRTIQIEELLKQKDEFIQLIGHDIKTPLTPLVAILPYIRKKVSDPEIGELLDNSIEDVATIRKLVSKILELAQMNSLYMISDIQEIAIWEMVNQVISDNAYLIHQKSLEIINIIPKNYKIMMSPMHFETVAGNLIGNAIKYSFIEGKVTIQAQDIGDSIVITIEDIGIGIEKEHITRIFDEFYRADNSRHERGSHGLGLAIAKRVVEIYSGKISVFSDGAGKGTTFQVQLNKNPDVNIKRKSGLL
ncbi:ATP-binding protein [Methanospirillum stamsii]|uniref:sensor histidine kinase n=1 Tax=Methanospirillum stamsii TaxID=1277351 RepID=UPI0015E85FCD|nr:HAMP domain-containing sensor histidine kinase [Methanospirillum stamsii]